MSDHWLAVVAGAAIGLQIVSDLWCMCADLFESIGSESACLFVYFALHVFLVLVPLQRICDGFVVVVGASAPIAGDVFAL